MEKQRLTITKLRAIKRMKKTTNLVFRYRVYVSKTEKYLGKNIATFNKRKAANIWVKAKKIKYPAYFFTILRTHR